MARRRAGPAGLSDELIQRAHAWAEQSCADQGLPTKISDRATLVQVASLLGAPLAGARRAAAPPAAAPTAGEAE